MDFEWKQRILFMFVVTVPAVVMAASSGHPSGLLVQSPPEGIIWSRNPTKVKALLDFQAVSKQSHADAARAGVTDEELPLCKNPPLPSGFSRGFDARKQWIACPSLWEIRDQGTCNSWSSAVASVLTDRFCIAHNGTVSQFRISDHDLLSCASRADETEFQGNLELEQASCKWANLSEIWDHLKTTGVVTGGYFGSNDGCKPTKVKPCDPLDSSEDWSCKSRPPAEIMRCEKQCLNPSYNGTYSEDLKKIEGACRIASGDDAAIMSEIFHHGPVLTIIPMYDSLVNFKPADENDIYFVMADPKNDVIWDDNHVVKIVGWGTNSDGKDYWILANSWNYIWGEGGFFKIDRGADNNLGALNVTALKPLVQHKERDNQSIFTLLANIFG